MTYVIVRALTPFPTRLCHMIKLIARGHKCKINLSSAHILDMMKIKPGGGYDHHTP